MTDTVDVFFQILHKSLLSPHFTEHPNKHAKQGYCSVCGQIRNALLYTAYLQQRNDIKLSIELQDFTAQQNHHGDF